jgi:hypothetical protein
MATKTRVFKNETKVPQVYYNKLGDPVTVLPGKTYTEDLSNMVSLNDLLNRERERIRLQNDVDESKRVKKALALIRVAKTVEDLEKFKDDETNPEVLDAILLKEKELSDTD